jgi:hypothetical protein
MRLTEAVMPRSQISVGVEPALRIRLTELAAGRPLVLDWFGSRRCGIVIGDLTAKFRHQPPGQGYVELASIERVRVFAEESLLPVLRDAELTLRLGGPSFARHLAISLDPGSRWIEFLEQPMVLSGKRRFRPKP